MNMNQAAKGPFLQACNRQAVRRVPIWLMRQAGRYMKEYRELRAKHSMLEICKSAKLCAEVTLQPIKAFELDAAILFTDLLMPLEAMGADLEYAKGEGPVIHNPVRNLEDAKRLKLIDPQKGLPYLYESIGLTRSLLDADIPLIGFGGAPFTMASYLIEGGHSSHFAATKSMMYGQPKTWKLLMNKIVDVMAACLQAQVRAGVQALQIFDSWIGSLSMEDYREFILPHSKRLLSEISGKGAPVIHFGTGNPELYPLMKQAGGDVLGVDWRIPIAHAGRIAGPKIGLQGNLDPLTLLGPKNFIKRRALDILGHVGSRPGFIFNLGHGILPQTPIDNVRFLVKTVHQFLPR